MKKTIVYSLLMVTALFLLTVTADISYAAQKGGTDPGEVDPKGFLGLKFGDNKKTVEKKLKEQGFEVEYSNKDGEETFYCSKPTVLRKKAESLSCRFFDNRLYRISVLWIKEMAPQLETPLNDKYGPPDDVNDSGNRNLRRWYVGDTNISLILGNDAFYLGDKTVFLTYSSIYILNEKENEDILNSL